MGQGSRFGPGVVKNARDGNPRARHPPLATRLARARVRTRGGARVHTSKEHVDTSKRRVRFLTACVEGAVGCGPSSRLGAAGVKGDYEALTFSR